MSLPHAILTALIEKPSSGLELTRRIDKSIRYFWPATHQQVYRELGRLEEAGLIRALPSSGPRKEYEVLPAGREELVAWVARPEDPKPLRSSLLLRLRAAAVVGSDGLAAELERHRALHQAQLEEYLDIERRDFTPRSEAEKDRLQHLVLQGGISLESHWVSWLDAALAELARPAPHDQPR
ncbi:PadR family transcriptional regulator [Streptacidiphilus monticola]|jgi:DNA-binding PadR family transcriptional regulator|uniref:PadR family transcriptional regulator n=1 Tax=Streptacidiphilus monticola TaxID=2161674 RepID=A0ABW1G9C3_9ACTN